MGKIKIEGIEIYAHHGFYKEEQKLGSRFRIDLEMEVDTQVAELSDELNDTVNYQRVYEVLKEQMKQQSKLLEHIAGRILQAVLDEFPMVNAVNINLSKLSPPINGNIEKVGVEIGRKRK